MILKIKKQCIKGIQKILILSNVFLIVNIVYKRSNLLSNSIYFFTQSHPEKILFPLHHDSLLGAINFFPVLAYEKEDCCRQHEKECGPSNTITPTESKKDKERQIVKKFDREQNDSDQYTDCWKCR